jgi:hypothetical protein
VRSSEEQRGAYCNVGGGVLGGPLSAADGREEGKQEMNGEDVKKNERRSRAEVEEEKAGSRVRKKKRKRKRERERESRV